MNLNLFIQLPKSFNRNHQPERKNDVSHTVDLFNVKIIAEKQNVR